MKTFLFSLLAFLTLLGAIVGNCFFVKSVSDSMQEQLLVLESPVTAQQTLPSLLEYWRRQERLLELSIPSNDLHEVACRLIEMQTAAQLEDDTAFFTARALCTESVLRIRNLERFSLFYIL